MSHYNDDFGQTHNSVYVAAALDAKATLHKEERALKLAQQRKKAKQAEQKRASQQLKQQLSQTQVIQQPVSPRASQPNMMMVANPAMQQGQLIMNTQLHQHRLRGQYFSAYEQKPWYCDCAGTNIGCAGGTVKGDWQLRDLAYWRCELDCRGLSKCGVSFCNACVIRDEQLAKSPRASMGHVQGAQSMMVTGQPANFNDPSHQHAASMGGNLVLQGRNMGGNASNSSQMSQRSTDMTAAELAALQAANENQGKKRSSKMGAKVYTEPNVVKRGWMLKRGNIVKSWKRRYFVLREDRQLYYYSNDKTSSVKGVAQFFEVEQIIKHDKQIFSVHLKGGRNWHFSCATSDDRDDWCAKLKLLCKAPVMIAKTKDKDDEKE